MEGSKGSMPLLFAKESMKARMFTLVQYPVTFRVIPFMFENPITESVKRAERVRRERGDRMRRKRETGEGQREDSGNTYD